MWQEQQEKDEYRLPPIGLTADAVYNAKLCFDRRAYTMLRATVAYTRALQPDEVVEGEEQEQSWRYLCYSDEANNEYVLYRGILTIITPEGKII